VHVKLLGNRKSLISMTGKSKILYGKLLVAICSGALLSCTSSTDSSENLSDDSNVLVCIADGVCNPDCQHDFDCNDDDVSEYNCEDTDGDGHNDYVFESCPQGDDYCSDDPNNWTLTGCESCIDSDGDGYGDNCSRGPDCDDEDATIYEDCPIICTDPPCGSAMVAIPAGCFLMGDELGQSMLQHDDPAHNVCITAFEMDTYEATNSQYENCYDAGACSALAFDESFTRYQYFGATSYNDYPVIGVSWQDAADFCTWAGKRLPTEAEWEYAARGGLAGSKYPWGDTISCADANYKYSNDSVGCNGDTAPTGSYAANGYGLYDMAGNVEEWTADYYGGDYYLTLPDPVTDPGGPDQGDTHVVRGGNWYGTELALYNFNRGGYESGTTTYGRGFRCAR
jgi:formylglycine-generating enzyme